MWKLSKLVQKKNKKKNKKTWCNVKNDGRDSTKQAIIALISLWSPGKEYRKGNKSKLLNY